MTFPEIVKTTLWDIIDEMSRSLSSFVKNPDKDFIRKRKLDFKKMMHLIVEEVDHKKFLTGLFDAMYAELPAPKQKRGMKQ